MVNMDTALHWKCRWVENDKVNVKGAKQGYYLEDKLFSGRANKFSVLSIDLTREAAFEEI